MKAKDPKESSDGKKESSKRSKNYKDKVVNLAKQYDLIAHNRDRGGAQHEQGDVEIEENFYGCKRRKSVPAWVMPEKEEQGVFFRAEYGPLMVSIPAELFYSYTTFLKN